MYCGNCGANLAEDQRFCHQCGEPVAEQRPGESDRAESVTSLTPSGIDDEAEDVTMVEEPVILVQEPYQDRFQEESIATLMTSEGDTTMDEVREDEASMKVAMEAEPWDESGPSPYERKPRRRMVALTCGILAVFVCLICAASSTGVYFWLGLNRSNEAAKIVPANTTAFAAFSPNLLQLAQLPNIANLTDGVGALAVVAGLPGVLDFANAMGEADIDMSLDIDPIRDVLPWIGQEVSLAILPSDEDAFPSGSYTGPPLVATVLTRNTNASDRFLDKIRTQLEDEGMVFEDSTYRNVDVVNLADSGRPEIAYATVANMVVLASNLDALEQTIDRALDDTHDALSAQDDFQDILNELPSNRLGYVYIGRDALRQSLDLSEELSESYGLNAVEKAAVAFSLTGAGIRLDYVVQVDESELNPDLNDVLSSSLDELGPARFAPSDASAIVTGRGPSALWYGVLNDSMERNVSRLRRDTGVDLAQDIVSELEGEYSLVAVRQPGGLWDQESLIVDLLLLSEIDNERRLETALEELFASAADDQDWNYEKDDIRGTQVATLESEDYFVIGYGISDGLLILGTSREVLESAIRESMSPLTEDDLFRRSVRPFPGELAAYGYLDVQSGLDVVDEGREDFRQGPLFDALEPYVNPIQAISVAIEPIDNQGIVRGLVLIVTN